MFQMSYTQSTFVQCPPNATGARLTSKRLTLQAPACNVMAVVEDKDCNSNKTVQNKRLANIGYWIRPGETIHADVIVIVPLNVPATATL